MSTETILEELRGNLCHENCGCHEDGLGCRQVTAADELERFHSLLRMIVRTWDALPTGHYRSQHVEDWLNKQMWPVIKEIKAALANEQTPRPTEK